MAKLTTRDRVWAAALDEAREQATGYSWRQRFDASDVAARLDDPPSSRTIRETLQSMAELGHLEKSTSQGRYQLPERDRELLDVDDHAENLREQLDQARKDRDRITNERDELQDELQDAQERDVGPRTPGAGETTVEVAAPEDRPADAPDDAPTIAVAIQQLDLPGSGDVLVERRDTIANVVRRIQEDGSASRSELLEDVVDPDAVGYGDGVSAWKNLLQPALHELAEDVDELRSPGEGGHRWRWSA